MTSVSLHRAAGLALQTSVYLTSRPLPCTAKAVAPKHAVILFDGVQKHTGPGDEPGPEESQLCQVNRLREHDVIRIVDVLDRRVDRVVGALGRVSRRFSANQSQPASKASVKSR